MYRYMFFQRYIYLLNSGSVVAWQPCMQDNEGSTLGGGGFNFFFFFFIVVQYFPLHML